MPLLGGLKAVSKIASYLPPVNQTADKKRPLVQTQILSFLWRWRAEKRLVNPSVATLAEVIGRTPRTIQRALAALSSEGLVVRVYNGGRARQAIYYLGKRAAEMAAEQPDADVPPLWGIEADRVTSRGEKTYQARLNVFGALRLGARALQRKGDPFVTLTGPHSLQREDLENQSTRDASRVTAETVASAAPKADTPPTPPSGGTVTTYAAPDPSEPPEADRASMALAALQTAQPGPSLGPPSPPPGGRGKKRQGRGGGKGPPVWQRFPALWRAAFGLWRRYHLAARRTPPPPDSLRDARAMSGIVADALMATRQEPEEALRFMAWGFRRCLKDDRLGGGGRPLWIVRKFRAEYGFPPDTFTTPPRDKTTLGKPLPRARAPEVLPKNGHASSSSSSAHGEQSLDPARHTNPPGPGAVVPQCEQSGSEKCTSDRAPRPTVGALSKLDRARMALRAAELRVNCRPSDARARADARELAEEIKALEGSGPGTDSETR